MFELNVQKNQIAVTSREDVTSGSAGVYRVRFTFSEDWTGLTKTAVFRAGGVGVSVLLTGEECDVPPEVTGKCLAGYGLRVGLYGVRGDAVILNTVWSDLATIQDGVCTPHEEPFTPSQFDQVLAALAKKGDGLSWDGAKLALVSEGKEVSSVVINTGGGGGGGTSDHRLLSHREDENQHPVEAISGLDEISNVEILKLWNGGN